MTLLAYLSDLSDLSDLAQLFEGLRGRRNELIFFFALAFILFGRGRVWKLFKRRLVESPVFVKIEKRRLKEARSSEKNGDGGAVKAVRKTESENDAKNEKSKNVEKE